MQLWTEIVDRGKKLKLKAANGSDVIYYPSPLNKSQTNLEIRFACARERHVHTVN